MKRVEGLIYKIPLAAISLFKLGFNYTVVYPIQRCFDLAKYTADLFLYRPIKYTAHLTKSVLFGSLSIINKYNPLASKN